MTDNTLAPVIYILFRVCGSSLYLEVTTYSGQMALTRKRHLVALSEWYGQKPHGCDW